MERINEALQGIEQSPNPKKVLIDLARLYVDIAGWDADLIFPKLEDLSFWQAEYLGKEKEGKEWGMSSMDALRCLLDTERTLKIFSGIRETADHFRRVRKRDLVGIDAGTGTGILAMYMAAQGCGHVYALEINQKTADITKEFIDRCGFSDKITLLVGDATTIQLPRDGRKQPSILVSENLASGLFDEPQFQIIGHLSRIMSKDALILPYASELFVSLAWADWKDVDPDKNNIAFRRLAKRELVSARRKYGEVYSYKGMRIPQIKGNVLVTSTSSSLPINTLVFSTRFQVNAHGRPSFIEPDTAEFLGKSSAFRLPEAVTPQNGMVDISLSYDAGFPRSQRELTVVGNKITFVGHIKK